MNKTLDQYNNPIPADLTLLDVSPTELTESQIKAIDELNWYCFEGNRISDIFVSQTELEKALDGLIDNISPEDCVFKPERFTIVKIDDCLHRWDEDSFY